MFSLKKTIASIDERESRFDAAIDCYLGAILDFQEHAVEITPELTHDHKLALRSIHRDLYGERSVEALAASRTALVQALENFREKARACLEQREDDVKSMIGELANAAETMSAHNETHSTRLKDFTQKLQTTARATSLDQMKRDLTKHVAELRSTSQSIWTDNVNSAALLQSKLMEFQDRLESAERRASTDPLTGLLNRGEAECRLRRWIDQGKLVSILLIDLNGFKQINDKWGHLCGDQVLRVFSRNLEQLVRPLDNVCRWGGDEFLVLCQGEGLIEHSRAAKIREMLRAQYRIVAIGKVFEIQVSASVGVAQAREGESIDDLLARADADMYNNKNVTKQLANLPIATNM